VTRAYFEQQIALAPTSASEFRILLDPGTTASEREAVADRLWTSNPGWNSMLRTTCIVTLVEGGHATNALPQRATANINCRILPGVAIEDVRRTIQQALADDGIKIEAIGNTPVMAPMPTIDARMLGPVRAVAESLWPGVAVVPTLATGATDGRYLNAASIPTYGLSGLFHDAEGPRARAV
jgi:acetylornithine deacetylase/succinyl-diaminopimelate desuccinylase-like protein